MGEGNLFALETKFAFTASWLKQNTHRVLLEEKQKPVLFAVHFSVGR